MVIEQRYLWGRAYRGGQLVCTRVHVTIGRDHRLGLAGHERRYVLARFQERVDDALRTELIQMVRRRGTAARRIAENLQPIELVIDDPQHGRQRLVGRLQPPQLRFGELREIEFSVHELQRAP